MYQVAPKNPGYNNQLTNQKSIKNKSRDTKQLKRKIIWFNPTYRKNVSRKAGNQFLKLINKHVSRHQKFYKLFNKNNVKAASPTCKT